MRIIALGDTHGRNHWKQIINQEPFDKVIFIGDYFDTHEDITPEKQISNFEDIITFKKAHRDKVILLFGNHDYHYLKTSNEIYSGYQREQHVNIQDIIHSALDAGLLQMCFVWQHFLFSHAGITKTWCSNNHIHLNTIDVSINNLFISQPQAFKFAWGKNQSASGDDVEQSPIWVRPNSLYIDKVDSYIQIVGHTTQLKLMLDNDVLLIDTLGTSMEYLIIEDQGLRVGRK